MDNDDNVLDIDKLRLKKEKAKLLEKSEKIVEELEMVLYILNLTINGLSNFTKYVFVMECISTIQNNKILLEINLSKYKKAIVKIKEEMADVKLEKNDKKNS
jgi:hypothetical protein